MVPLDFSSLVEESKDEILELFCELLRQDTINTGIMPTGNERRAASVLEKKLEEEKIDCRVLSKEKERGNLLAKLAGKKSTPRILYLSHLDVVPVEDETKWNYPPFGAETNKYKIYGRGAADCKDIVTAEAMALILLKRAGAQPNHDIVFSAVADEEGGGDYGLKWLLETHPQEVLTDFAINESGGIPLKNKSPLVYSLCTGEKGSYTVDIETFGKSFHSSKPWLGQNALNPMWKVLRRIEDYKPLKDISLPIFSNLNDLVGVKEKPSSVNIDRIIKAVQEKDKNLAESLTALSRMTLAPTIIRGGVKSNVIPSQCKLTCNLRTLPNQDRDFVSREMKRVLQDLKNVRYKVRDRYSASTNSPFQTRFKDSILISIRRALNDNRVEVFPTLSTGSSDSRLLRPHGSIVYGFSPIHPAADMITTGAHCPNECTDIRSILLKTKMFLFLATTM